MNKSFIKFLPIFICLVGCTNIEEANNITPTASYQSFPFEASLDMNTKLTLSSLDDEVLNNKTNEYYLVLKNTTKQEIHISLEKYLLIFAVSGTKAIGVDDSIDVMVSPDVIPPKGFLILHIEPEIPPNVDPDHIFVVVLGSFEKDAQIKTLGASIRLPYDP